MSSAPTPEEIVADARWLAQALDAAAGEVRLVAMDRESYRAASFLDDRLLQQPVDAQLLPWPTVEDALTEDMRNDARWIFHIGHVGSTLISRMVGELDNVLALREPRLLRDVTLSPPAARERYCKPIAKLMSRTFADDEIACVKATSIVSELAPRIVPSGARVLLMYATARNYISNTLAGENSVKELRMLANLRLRRLEGRVPAIGPARNDADLAAIAWACEMTSLENAAERMSGCEINWLDFDRMLLDPAAALGATAEFFGFAATPAQIEAIATGPIMGRYSKLPDYEYSAALRRELIAQAQLRHGPAIHAALAMLHSAAEKSPLLARAITRAEAKG